MNCEKPYCTFALTVLAGAWILIALFIGETELLRLLPAPVIPVTIWSLVGLLLLAFWKNRPFRAFVDQLDTRILIALHLTRFVGIYFLYLHAKGELPAAFAKTAGWGDIIVASAALPLLFHPAPKWTLAWNIAGLIDIIFVVVNAAIQLFGARESMNPFITLPLSFLPTLVVPLIISSHIVMLLRLHKESRPVVSPPRATIEVTLKA
jgi:hypothetical protein